MDFCDALRRVKALGFDAAETYNWKGLDFDAVRRTCQETGVELLHFLKLVTDLCRLRTV